MVVTIFVVLLIVIIIIYFIVSRPVMVSAETQTAHPHTDHVPKPVVKHEPVTVYGECPVCGKLGGGASCASHLGYSSWIEYE